MSANGVAKKRDGVARSPQRDRRSKRRQRVLLAIPLSWSRFYRQAAEAFVHQLGDGGYSVELIDAANAEVGQCWAVEGGALAGLAISAGLLDHPGSAQVPSSVPTVLLGEGAASSGLDRVSIDHGAIAYRLTAMLCEKRHAVIALAGNLQDAVLFDGFDRSLSDHGYPKQPRPRISLEPEQDGDETALELALAMAQRQRPTGFLCTDARVAATLDRQLNALGFVCGEHVDLAAIDDDGISEERGLSMFRVARPAYSFGAEAARLLLRRISEPTAEREVVTLASGPVITGITGATIEPPRRRGGSHL